MEDPYHVRIIVRCAGAVIGLQPIDRRTDYDDLLQLLSEMTGCSLNQYSLSVSAKLDDGNTSQRIPITCNRVLRFFFDPAQGFRTVELFVDVQEALPPQPSHVPTEEPYTQYGAYATGRSEQSEESDEEDDTRHHGTMSESNHTDSLLGPDPGASGPETESSDEDNDGGHPVYPSNVRIAPHPTLSRASFLDSSYEEVTMDSVDMPSGDFTYDEEIGILNKGMIFADKKSVQAAVKHYSIRHAMREYYVIESTPEVWKVGCKQNAKGTAHDSSVQQCNWSLRAIHVKKHGTWKITKYGPHHSCLINPTNQRHYNLDKNLIAGMLESMVRKDPSYTADCAQVMVKDKFGYEVSYNMAWKAIKRAIENVYGTWESSCAYLPKFMRALQKYNPGTVVEWHHEEDQPTGGVYTLGYVFWAFKPVIDAWQYCRKVITVDGTHLYAKFKHKLLIAIGVDANKKILPLAYAIVDEESYNSWRWFLRCLAMHVVQGAEGVCLISDRHKGLLSAVDDIEDFREPKGVHRYCLRHVGSNLNSRFKNVQLKDLCYAAGKAPNIRKWTRIMDQIKELSIGAFEYLRAIDPAKWTYCYDQGRRYGVMTTNMSECFNGVLVGARRLPITAIVRITFGRSKKSFMEREVDAKRIQQTNQAWPDSILKSFDREQRLALSLLHNVDIHNIAAQSASVSSVHPGSRRPYTYTVQLTTRECSCGQWSNGGVPCSHVMAVCRQFGVNPVHYMHPCYSTQTYVATYTSGRFFPLADEAEWDEPYFRLQHNEARRKIRRGRGVSTRIPNEMDWPQARARQRYQATNRARGSNQGSTSRRD